MGRDADVVVIGAGIAGAAAARALAQARRDVLVLEQFEPGHTRGSSHGSSRIFRLSYPDAAYVQLAQRALAAWHELEAEHGQSLITHSGSLDFGGMVERNAKALASCGARYELLDGREVSARWQIAADINELVLYQPDGGVTRADRATSALLAGALAAGAELRAHTRVQSMRQEPRRILVETEDDVVRGKVAVVTAGAWARALLAPLGIDLPVVPTRETVAYFRLAGAEQLPAVIDHALARAGRTPFGVAAPGTGVKAGIHHSGPVTDPDEIGAPDKGLVGRISAWVERRLPEADPSLLRSETCLYTNTDDESFVLERHGRVVIGSACSGHGFKFAPVIGQKLALLATEVS